MAGQSEASRKQTSNRQSVHHTVPVPEINYRKKPLTLNHDTQVRPAEGAVGILSNLNLSLRVDEEHGWLWEGVLSLPDVAWVTHVQTPPVHVSQPEAVGDAVGDLLGLCGGTQAVQLHNTDTPQIRVCLYRKA